MCFSKRHLRVVDAVLSSLGIHSAAETAWLPPASSTSTRARRPSMDARRSWPQGPRPSSASRDPSSSRMAQSSRDASSAHAKEYSQAHDPRSSIQARHVGDRREFNSNHGQSRDLFRTEARAERSDDDEFSTPSPPPKIKQEEEVGGYECCMKSIEMLMTAYMRCLPSP